MLESQLLEWSVIEDCRASSCIGSKKLRLQNQLTNLRHRDRLWGETISLTSICLMRWLRLQKLLNTHVHFRKRVSVEEQRAKNRFLRGRQIAYMICEHFRANGAYEALQGLSDLFTTSLQNDNVNDFDVRWGQAPLSATSKITTFDGLKLYCQQAICLQMWSWKDCASQNYRTLFSFRLSWHCTINKPFETMSRQVIFDWRRL